MNSVFIAAQGDGVEEVTCSVEDACLTDVCTGIRLQWLLNKPLIPFYYLSVLSQHCWQWMQHYFLVCNVLCFNNLSFALCTADPNELSDDREVTSARDNGLSSMAAEEMVICITHSFPMRGICFCKCYIEVFRLCGVVAAQGVCNTGLIFTQEAI